MTFGILRELGLTKVAYRVEVEVCFSQRPEPLTLDAPRKRQLRGLLLRERMEAGKLLQIFGAARKVGVCARIFFLHLTHRVGSLNQREFRVSNVLPCQLEVHMVVQQVEFLELQPEFSLLVFKAGALCAAGRSHFPEEGVQILLSALRDDRAACLAHVDPQEVHRQLSLSLVCLRQNTFGYHLCINKLDRWLRQVSDLELEGRLFRHPLRVSDPGTLVRIRDPQTLILAVLSMFVVLATLLSTLGAEISVRLALGKREAGFRFVA